MSNQIDLQKLTLVEQMGGDDPTEIQGLRSLYEKARAYLESFEWNTSIAEAYLGYGVGGVLGLFLFKMQKPIDGTDNWIWIVVGDLPSAYFVVDESRNAASAMETYCRLMEDWAKAVISGKGIENVFPVKAEPTKQHAEMLLTRINLIRTKIIPSL